MQWRRLKFFKNVKIIDKCFNVIKMWVECHQLWQSLSSSTDILQTCDSSGLGSAWNILHHYQWVEQGGAVISHIQISNHTSPTILSVISSNQHHHWYQHYQFKQHMQQCINFHSYLYLGQCTCLWSKYLKKLFFITLKACSQCNNILIISAGVHSAALQRSDKCWKPLSQLPLASNI